MAHFGTFWHLGRIPGAAPVAQLPAPRPGA